MKKNPKFVLFQKKILLQMKLTLLLIMLCAMQISASVTVYEKVTLDMQNELLRDNLIVIAPKRELQQQRVTGRVTDANNGEPLPGVNIVVEGTIIGTITDGDGRYSLTVPERNAILNYSFIGYDPISIPVEGRSVIDVALTTLSVDLDEIIVVGYGTQRRVNLTGSVSQVSGDDIERRNVSQASNLLQGLATGVTARQGSGSPGNDGTSLTVRGLGTFSGAGTSPLILVDGVISSINNVNPNNIESITVLKDAAASSIYGSRAANGVILVTTKTGKAGMLQVSYDTYVGLQSATELPNFVDSWVYAEMFNEMMINEGLATVYTQAEIDLFKAGTDPDNYPNVKHLEKLMNSGNGFQIKNNLTFQGGTDASRFFVSTGYLRQNGIVEQNHYDRYDLLTSLTTKLKDNLILDIRLTGYKSYRTEPAGMSSSGDVSSMLGGIVQRANHDHAGIPGQKSDGSYALAMGHPNLNARLASGSFADANSIHILPNVLLEWNIVENLKWRNRISYEYNQTRSKLFGATHWINPELTIGPNRLTSTNYNSDRLILESLVNYDLELGQDHVVNFLGGISSEEWNDHTLSGYRDNLPSDLLYHLNAGSQENARNTETANAVSLLSQFGRVNYAYQNKYLFEGNIRRDGSSRFDKNNRWGIFPSFSAGWRISEENFFQVPWIANLTMRGSWGILGNQSIGNYPYQKVLSLGSTYYFGDRLNPGVMLTSTPFEGITWETTKITNAGIDFTLFDGSLKLIADYYHKKTEGILYSLTVSTVMGMTVGAQNAGIVDNHGMEFELIYRKSIGDLSIRVQPNFAVNNNQVSYLAGVKRDINAGLFIGQPLQSYFGYRSDGLFVDQPDINSYPTQNYPAKPGLPRLKDLNGDDQITAGNDREVLGSRFPKYTYGMGIAAGYKGFDFNIQLHGLGGFHTMLTGDQLAVYNYGNMQQWQVDRRWTYDNPNPKAEYPRFEMAYHRTPWNTTTDYWMRNASFLRVNNIQLGYDIPAAVLQNIFIERFRIYVNGENIHTFHGFYQGWDPEMIVSGTTAVTYYPVTRVWSLGINVNF